MFSLHQKNTQWIKVAESLSELDVDDNGLCIVEYDNKKFTLAVFKEKIFACAYKCPHAGGILGEGYMDALGNIVCPLHRYKYSLENGRNVSGEGYYLKTYKAELREDGVYICL